MNKAHQENQGGPSTSARPNEAKEDEEERGSEEKSGRKHDNVAGVFDSKPEREDQSDHAAERSELEQKSHPEQNERQDRYVWADGEIAVLIFDKGLHFIRVCLNNLSGDQTITLIALADLAGKSYALDRTQQLVPRALTMMTALISA